jgi:hypothetical protein
MGCLSRPTADYFKWVKNSVQDGLDIPEGHDSRRIGWIVLYIELSAVGTKVSVEEGSTSDHGLGSIREDFMVGSPNCGCFFFFVGE